MRKFVSLIILAFGFVCLSACGAQATADASIELMQPMDFVQAFNEADSDAYLIDCRTPNEYAKGSLHGAQNLDYRSAKFAQSVEALDTTRTVYVFCQAGGRSAAAAQVFAEKGFKEIVDMKGGYGAFKSSGVDQPKVRN